MKLSKAAVGILSMVMVSGAIHAQEVDAKTEEAASAIAELINAGYLKVQPESGKLAIDGSVVEVFKRAGLATEKLHAADGPISTEGGHTSKSK